MKNMNYFLSALFVVGTLSGCSSSWNQDPLAEKDKVLQDGQPKPTTPEKPEAIPSDSVRLVHPEYLGFQEGMPNEFVMTGRILIAGYVPTVIIENMSDFPGAHFDAASGKFSWSPPLGTVSVDSADTTEVKLLKVKVIGQKNGDGVVQNAFVVQLNVKKVLNAPEISQISNTNISVREGEVTTITVNIRDRDAGVAPATWPKVQAWPLLGFANLSQFVTVTNILAAGNGTYAVTLKIDLTGAELTKSKGSYGFALQAISRFQQGSMTQNIYVSVLTSFATLQSTWFDVLDFSLSVKDEHQFLIYDPKEEVLVGTPSFTGAPAGASFTCSDVGISRQLCKMTWAPDFTAVPGDFTVKANVVLKNQDKTDTLSKTQTFDLLMRVNSAPPVSPVSQVGGN